MRLSKSSSPAEAGVEDSGGDGSDGSDGGGSDSAARVVKEGKSLGEEEECGNGFRSRMHSDVMVAISNLVSVSDKSHFPLITLFVLYKIISGPRDK